MYMNGLATDITNDFKDNDINEENSISGQKIILMNY